ncbi:P-loop containing nucleoside triphosphate hydrolase protein [Coccomyxa subellipsoidea C-169]|uniref:P-loop containing nucleoside triphosphate hydrolase protein n=1 Tax=Coccomyxa subellipsoidea (strain C-169) TaxID=574566 RepID=I0YZX5_COCSC|nr:P-loop containing nucleoside triphosphate hydrolase protein [Coccomyxa subellipsoidea C-169]EIE23944.1 P-loop containing nucleoside triphosphate hydrolase protein [Coccomyxa subellipsoidea C-169]|eukprot:XP_005648488.1 P-loop containing nucleoside triphosphate hydrolase protein [Coccomyxa subellipsoidea C-169]
MSATLEVHDLKRVIGDRTILTDISFSVRAGEKLFIRGPSGVGKSLLLRALAYLDPIQGGTLFLDGKAPEQIGVPQWRTQVTYVPQSRTQQKGTPSELYFAAQQFKAQRGRPRGDLPALVAELGLEQSVLNQPWIELSGGQAQRVTLAICIALKPTFLLLDEPTSALDHDSALAAERVLTSSGCGLIWITHEDAQPLRVGGRVLQLPLGTEVVTYPK